MPHIKSSVDLGESFEQWKGGILLLLPNLMYESYYSQRQYGLTHEQCEQIGISPILLANNPTVPDLGKGTG